MDLAISQPQLIPKPKKQVHLSENAARLYEWMIFFGQEGLLAKDHTFQFAKGWQQWSVVIGQALKDVGRCDLPQTYKCRTEYGWKLSAGRIISAYTRHDSLESGETVNAIALKCLAQNCRVCLKQGCSRMFVMKGKK
ncbi:MAG TPA: hypothetical protein DDY39_16235 [Nitrospira sp.]|nr:hypothetical protein [Nitrospira sp.]HBR50518.1 hypothetical protein [Nitrospira sp.]